MPFNYFGHNVEGLGSGLINGATAGLAPRASAAGRALVVNPVLDALQAHGIGQGGNGQSYLQMLQDYQAHDRAVQQAHPTDYLSGQFLGNIPSSLAAGASIPAHAALGAVRGYTTAEQMGQDPMSGAAAGGTLGALTGSLGTVANGERVAAPMLLNAQQAAIEKAGQDPAAPAPVPNEFDMRLQDIQNYLNSMKRKGQMP